MTRTQATLAVTTLAALGLAAALPQGARAQGVFDFTYGHPRGSSGHSGYSGTLGVQFTVPASAGAVTVSELGFFAPNVTQDSHMVGIFDDATRQLVPGSAGDFVTFLPGMQGPDPSTYAGSYAYLPDTLVLTPGTYTVAVNYPNNGGAQQSNDVFDDITGPFSHSGDIIYDSGEYSYTNDYQGATLDFPGGGGAYASANISVAPEPSQTAALGLGLLGLAGLALKARRRTA